MNERLGSAEYHKCAVYQRACELCLKQKNITLKTAIKRVLQKEKEGTPAYRQETKNNEGLVRGLKSWVELLKNNEQEIILEIIVG